VGLYATSSTSATPAPPLPVLNLGPLVDRKDHTEISRKLELYCGALCRTQAKSIDTLLTSSEGLLQRARFLGESQSALAKKWEVLGDNLHQEKQRLRERNEAERNSGLLFSSQSGVASARMVCILSYL
jgi:hypothetical protein